MGRHSTTGGVLAFGQDRIQFEFQFEGRRFRPTLLMTPTALDLRRARENLGRIKARIAAGTFSSADEFPDYRYLRKVVDSNELRTCNRVFDEFLAHCEARRAKHDLSEATLRGYRKAVDRFWRPRLGEVTFLKVRYSELVRIADAQKNWSKKTYNNAVSVLRGHSVETMWRTYSAWMALSNPTWHSSRNQWRELRPRVPRHPLRTTRLERKR
jgi:integrase